MNIDEKYPTRQISRMNLSSFKAQLSLTPGIQSRNTG